MRSYLLGMIPYASLLEKLISSVGMTFFKGDALAMCITCMA